MVWGAWYPSNPFVLDNGRGPSYTHSLFEDNAEYGYGQVKAYNNRVKNMLLDI